MRPLAPLSFLRLGQPTAPRSQSGALVGLHAYPASERALRSRGAPREPKEGGGASSSSLSTPRTRGGQGSVRAPHTCLGWPGPGRRHCCVLPTGSASLDAGRGQRKLLGAPPRRDMRTSPQLGPHPWASLSCIVWSCCRNDGHLCALAREGPSKSRWDPGDTDQSTRKRQPPPPPPPGRRGKPVSGDWASHACR